MKSIYLRSIGWLSLIVGTLMTIPAVVAYYHAAHDGSGGRETYAFVISIAVAFASGIVLLSVSRGGAPVRISVSDGFLAAASSWITVAIFSALPYVISGAIPGFVDAFFESMSGLTTTGATTLATMDGTPPGIMLWRCMTQGIGGMGIVVLFVAILPAVGEGGHNLFRAEVPGGANFEKVTPRIRETARALWMIYVGFMALETAALTATGMSLFDAICHALTTLSTGGFSPYTGSVGDVPSLTARWIIIFFMLIGGSNFALHFRAIRGEGRATYLGNTELKLYLGLIVLAGAVLSIDIIIRDWESMSVATGLTDGFFQVTSIVTTTGYATADFGKWSPFAQSLIFILMFAGGCSGSTGGGIKAIRSVIAMKSVVAELRVMANPREVVAPKLQGRPLSDEAMRNTLVFMALYVTMFVAGGLVLALLGSDMTTSFSASATCLGNVGPGLGLVGPAFNFGHLHAAAKLVLIVEMLMGRLELFGVMIFFMAIMGKRRKGTKTI